MMELHWTDTEEIAIALNEAHPEVDPQTILFTDLRDWIMQLENFHDDPGHCGERILEAIQMAWIEEKQ